MKIVVDRVWSDAEPCRSGYWMWVTTWQENSVHHDGLDTMFAYDRTWDSAIERARRLVRLGRAVIR